MIAIMRGVVLRDASVAGPWPNVAALLAMSVVLVWLGVEEHQEGRCLSVWRAMADAHRRSSPRHSRPGRSSLPSAIGYSAPGRPVASGSVALTGRALDSLLSPCGFSAAATDPPAPGKAAPPRLGGRCPGGPSPACARGPARSRAEAPPPARAATA